MRSALGLFLLFCSYHAQAAEPISSDEWVALVMQLRAREALLDKDDKQFLFRMTNILTAKDDALPDAAQRKWILDIERRVMGGR